MAKLINKINEQVVSVKATCRKKTIGMKKLAVARVAHEYGISMQEVAEKLGISRRALSSRVNENPTLSSLTQVAEVIGCDITDLFK